MKEYPEHSLPGAPGNFDQLTVGPVQPVLGVVVLVQVLLDIITKVLKPFPATGVCGTGAMEHLVH